MYEKPNLVDKTGIRSRYESFLDFQHPQQCPRIPRRAPQPDVVPGSCQTLKESRE